MRVHHVGDTPFKCPRYVVRVPGGWQLRMPGAKTVFIGDEKHGGPAGSHAVAVKMREEALPVDPLREGCGGRGFATIERESKLRPTGCPGIYISNRPRREGRSASVYLVVSRKGSRDKLIYVGTPNTWGAKFPERMQRAIAIREEWMRSRSTEGQDATASQVEVSHA